MNCENAKEFKIPFEDCRVYTENSIVRVSKEGIALEDSFLIDFKECVVRFNQVYGASIHCVGERNIIDYTFVFYTADNPTMIKFVRKNRLFEFFDRNNTAHRFYNLQKQITQYGYSTYDMT